MSYDPFSRNIFAAVAHSPILPGRIIYEGLVAVSWQSPEVPSIGSHIVNNCFHLLLRQFNAIIIMLLLSPETKRSHITIIL